MNYIDLIKKSLIIGAVMAQMTTLMAMENSSLTGENPSKVLTENTNSFSESNHIRNAWSSNKRYECEHTMIEDAGPIVGGAGTFDVDESFWFTIYGYYWNPVNSEGYIYGYYRNPVNSEDYIKKSDEKLSENKEDKK